ncbi:MAG: 23S rRNA (adenine(2503)-C(2))-methyltransferase RlmN [Firmicutes bacterium]|nr:23S rRNA (adenine(2503)-C(2))-methyltransferase RlmN [Bacillota bacterium]
MDICEFYLSELEEYIAQRGIKKFRAKQIFQWIHQKGVFDFYKMKNLPVKESEWFCHEFELAPLAIVTKRVSQDQTEKYVFRLEDGQTIETVLIPHGKRQTVCVSTQVGCSMGCKFCATGSQGLVRNLTTSEIVRQAIQVNQSGGVTNIVFMGMGEPFANYDRVIRAIRLFNEPLGLNIGMRRMTVSTCGLVPMIKRFADEEIQVVLAISLHSAIDEKRSETMPINNKYPIDELINACRYYIEKTNRRITFEYALIKGFNDGKEDLDQLIRTLEGLLCNVNLIPINEFNGEYSRPDDASIKRVYNYLKQGDVEVAIRDSRGSDIEGACGQLRRSVE